MRQIRQLLRLNHERLSDRKIGCTFGVARSTFLDSLNRAKAPGLAWPLTPELNDDILEQRLFARRREDGRPAAARAGLGGYGAT